MRRVFVIVWKEWRVALDTPLGYVVATAFLLASGFFFGNHLFISGQADMRGYFSVMPLLLMFFIPAMSMRMLADEQQGGTFELLATMPVQTWEIVAGKFVAVLMQVSILIGLTILYPVTLSIIGNPDGGQIAASYLALLLLSACYIAISLYASSLTRHAVVAYVIGFSMLFGLFLLMQAMATFPVGMQDLIAAMVPTAHYQLMLRGVIGLNNVGMLTGTATIFLLLSWFQLERRRWQ